MQDIRKREILKFLLKSLVSLFSKKIQNLHHFTIYSLLSGHVKHFSVYKATIVIDIDISGQYINPITKPGELETILK